MALLSCLFAPPSLGYQIAYLVFGWLIGTLALLALVFLITFTTVLPILGVYGWDAWMNLVHVLFYNPNTGRVGAMLIAIINYIILMALVVVFFQIRTNSVALRNRHLFHLVCFLKLQLGCWMFRA